MQYLAYALLGALLGLSAPFQGRGPLWILGKVPDRNPYGCTASPSATYVGPSASITDSGCAVWTLGSGTTPNIVILRNGAPATSNAKGSVIEYYLGVVYVKGTDGATWYSWNNSSGDFDVFGTNDPSMSMVPTGYFVSTSGSNSNDCTAAQNVATPKLTLNNAMQCLTGATVGKTLWVRAGTYNESLIDVIPSGTSASNIVRIIAYPGETVTMWPTTGSPQRIFYFDGPDQYITIDGINMNGASLSDTSVFFDDRGGSVTQNSVAPPHHITFQNLTIAHRNNLGGGNTNAAVLIAGHDNLFTNTNVSGIGGPYAYYIHGQNNTVENSELHDTASAFVQIYANQSDCGACASPTLPDGNVVRNNNMHDISTSNQFGVADGRLWGVIAYNGGNSRIYNNIIRGLALPYLGGNSGIAIGGTGNKVWNNTVYGNTTEGITVASTATATSVQNNIQYLNTGGNYVNGAGSQTTHTNNLEGVNPVFVDVVALNFRLQFSSPAKDTGVSLGTFFTTDKEAIPRPQGPSWDIGAYEYH